MWSQKASFDVLRSRANGAITGAYAAVGAPCEFAPRLLCITNQTNGNMIFSLDGVTDHIFIPANSFKLYDISTNRNEPGGAFVFPKYTTVYVKQSTAPTTGSVYVEFLYGVNDV